MKVLILVVDVDVEYATCQMNENLIKRKEKMGFANFEFKMGFANYTFDWGLEWIGMVIVRVFSWFIG